MTQAPFYCPHCGHANKHTAQFCGHCGHPLPSLPLVKQPPWHRILAAISVFILLLVAGSLYFSGQFDAFLSPGTGLPTLQPRQTTPNPIADGNEETATITTDPNAIAIVAQTSAAMRSGEVWAETSFPTTASTIAPMPTTALPPVSDLIPTALPTITLTPIPARIVFQSNRDGDFEIFIIHADGGHLQQLTSNESDDQYPRVSPNGQQIAFQSMRDGNSEIYVMGIDGSNPLRLTNNDVRDILPAWSPDNSQIVFNRENAGNQDVYLMDANGHNQRRLADATLRDGHASWSTRNQIAFNGGTRDGNTWEIYVIDADGRNLTQLTYDHVSDWSPEWSANGSTILYLHELDVEAPSIYQMNADGTNQQMLINIPGYEWGQIWANNSQNILFSLDQGAFTYLYQMNIDGSEVRPLGQQGSYPNWVPAGGN